MAASNSRSTQHPWQRGTFCLAFSSQSPGISSDLTDLGLMLTPECPGQVSECDNCLTWVMCLFLDSEMGTVPDKTHKRYKNKDGGKEVPPKKVRVKRRDECWAGKSSSCPASCLNPWNESCYQYVSMRAVMLNGKGHTQDLRSDCWVHLGSATCYLWLRAISNPLCTST